MTLHIDSREVHLVDKEMVAYTVIGREEPVGTPEIHIFPYPPAIDYAEWAVGQPIGSKPTGLLSFRGEDLATGKSETT